ncbi:MAG: DUF481 domain-containing protein [Rhodospirillaceae bacterium]|nr:DUF481 domain-containing protein [Rhodospirillaceae bacterium]
MPLTPPFYFRLPYPIAALVLAAPLLISPATAEDASVPNKTWVSEITFGGSIATGNTERTSLDMEAYAKYRSGRVLDEYKLSAEVAREAGTTTAERIKGGYQTNVDIQDGLFALAFANGEDDRFSGFKYELESGIGVGYRVINTSTMRLSFEGGPGYRYSKATPPLRTEREIFARGTADFEYKISDNATLNNEATISWDDQRTKVENTLSVSSKIIGALSGRTSLNVRYNSNPPAANLDKTDTITKIALVYRF